MAPQGKVSRAQLPVAPASCPLAGHASESRVPYVGTRQEISTGGITKNEENKESRTRREDGWAVT